MKDLDILTQEYNSRKKDLEDQYNSKIVKLLNSKIDKFNDNSLIKFSNIFTECESEYNDEGGHYVRFNHKIEFVVNNDNDFTNLKNFVQSKNLIKYGLNCHESSNKITLDANDYDNKHELLSQMLSEYCELKKIDINIHKLNDVIDFFMNNYEDYIYSNADGGEEYEFIGDFL